MSDDPVKVRATEAELAKGVTLRTGQTHLVTVAPPPVYRGRLTGMLFDKDKCFLLPGAMLGIRGLVNYFNEHPASEVLVVGHTDTTGTDSYNLPLSVERAESIAAFLREDDAAWMAWFGGNKPSEKRWGTREVQLMLTALPDASKPFYAPPVDGLSGPKTTDAVKQFQTYSNDNRGTSLKVDGIDGPLTRKALVQAYMAIEGTSLPAGTPLRTHGCGSFHPEVPTGPGVDEPSNRRAEVFLFTDGIKPPPQQCAAPGCSEYPQWLKALVETIDLDATTMDEALKLEIAVYKGDDADVALQIEEQSGTKASSLASADAAREESGYLIFSLEPAALPNPVVMWRVTGTTKFFLCGPVDPFALRQALHGSDLATADSLLGSAPGASSSGAEPTMDFDDSHL